MDLEIEVNAVVRVSVEFGAEDAARRLARDHVANDWLLHVVDGVAKDAGHFVVKGMSAEVGAVRRFGGNPNVVMEDEEEGLY